MDKNNQNVRGCCHYLDKCIGTVQSICNLRLNVSHKNLVVSQNGSNYDYHFSFKELLK